MILIYNILNWTAGGRLHLFRVLRKGWYIWLHIRTYSPIR